MSFIYMLDYCKDDESISDDLIDQHSNYNKQKTHSFASTSDLNEPQINKNVNQWSDENADHNKRTYNEMEQNCAHDDCHDDDDDYDDYETLFACNEYQEQSNGTELNDGENDGNERVAVDGNERVAADDFGSGKNSNNKEIKCAKKKQVQRIICDKEYFQDQITDEFWDSGLKDNNESWNSGPKEFAKLRVPPELYWDIDKWI